MDDSGTVNVVECLQRLVHVEYRVVSLHALEPFAGGYRSQASWHELHRNEDCVKVIGSPGLINFGDVRMIESTHELDLTNRGFWMASFLQHAGDSLDGDMLIP